MARSKEDSFSSGEHAKTRFRVDLAEFEDEKKLVGHGIFGNEREVIGCFFDYDKNGKNFDPRNTKVGIRKDIQINDEVFSTRMVFNTRTVVNGLSYTIPTIFFTVGHESGVTNKDVVVTVPFTHYRDLYQLDDAVAFIEGVGIIHRVEEEEAEESWLPMRNVALISPQVNQTSLGSPQIVEQGKRIDFPNNELTLEKANNLVTMKINGMLRSPTTSGIRIPKTGTLAETTITFPDPMSAQTRAAEKLAEHLHDTHIPPYAYLEERKKFCKELRERIDTLGYSINVRGIMSKDID